MKVKLRGWGPATEAGRELNTVEIDFAETERADGRIGENEVCFILRDRQCKVMGTLSASIAWWAEVERTIIEQHHGRVRAQMIQALRTGEPPQAVASAGIIASHEALKAEHERLRVQFAELTSQHEALQRDCHGEYSKAKTDPPMVHLAFEDEPAPIIQTFHAEPRSGDMHDVVDACRSAQPGT